ncbi:hypothetical protein F4780DRAFT_544506 [Xylariomycetidae sp. FL0641]|nr:hypothetical protein F4780DRAFT_544506 [Xylariomycetidae sp. FL0641]
MIISRRMGNDSDTVGGNHVVEVQPDADLDLPLYVEHQLHGAWASSLVRPGLFQTSPERIVDISKGNFLLASLLIDEVTSLSREQAVWKLLESLPETLEGAAPLILKRLERSLEPQDREDLMDMINWTALSKRSLSVSELDALLLLRCPEGARVIDLEERLRNHFSSLFAVSGE